jgi:outer membrane protein insertion porin family
LTTFKVVKYLKRQTFRIKKMKKAVLFLLILANTLGFTNTVAAQLLQDTLPITTYGAPKDYEIGGVKVTGTQFTDQNAIIGVSGLQVGKKIKFPGPDISVP